MYASLCRAWFCFAVSAVLTLPAAAQEFFWVHREGALPSKVAEFEKVSKEFRAFATANRDAMPTFSFEAWMSPDFAYTFVSPIGQSLAGGDTFTKEFFALGAKSPAPTLDIWHRGGDTTAWWDDSIFLLRGDLSYLPPTGRLQPGEHNFDQMDFYYIKPGYAADAEAVAAEIKALYEKKKMANGYAVLQAITGENPLYLVRSFEGSGRLLGEPTEGHGAARRRRQGAFRQSLRPHPQIRQRAVLPPPRPLPGSAGHRKVAGRHLERFGPAYTLCLSAAAEGTHESLESSRHLPGAACQGGYPADAAAGSARGGSACGGGDPGLPLAGPSSAGEAGWCEAALASSGRRHGCPLAAAPLPASGADASGRAAAGAS